MEEKEELKLLAKVKEQLLEKGDLSVILWEPTIYTLKISSEDWHEIFKTK